LPCAAGGEFALAQERLLSALQAPTDPARWGSAATDLDLHAALTESAAADEDVDALSRYASRLEADARSVGHRLYQAIALRAMGQAAAQRGDPSAAQSSLDLALSIFEAMRANWQVGRTLLARARLQGRQADAARADRQRAEAIFESMGAALEAAEAASVAR